MDRLYVSKFNITLVLYSSKLQIKQVKARLVRVGAKITTGSVHFLVLYTQEYDERKCTKLVCTVNTRKERVRSN